MNLLSMLRPAALRRRQDRENRLVAYLARRRYLAEDVTDFGQQLADLHVDTLAATLSEDARDHYRYALESYERAKSALEAAQDGAALEPVTRALVDGRHQRACVLAMAAGEPLPAQRAECFFNPQHGPSHTEVSWTPPGGVERTVPVCASDANRLARGQAPRMRLVRVGDRYVPAVVAEHEQGLLDSNIDARAVRDLRKDIVASAIVWNYGQPFKDPENG